MRFVAHVVPGNSGLLLSQPDLKALGAVIDDLRDDQMHLENPRVTLMLSTTPAVHYEVGLLNRTREAAVVDSLDKTPGSTVKVIAKDGGERRAAALRPASSCLNCCQIRGYTEKWKDMACSSECVCLRPPFDDFVGQRALSTLWEHVGGRPVEIATAQLQNGRQYVCTFTELLQKSEDFEIHSRSTHRGC